MSCIQSCFLLHVHSWSLSHTDQKMSSNGHADVVANSPQQGCSPIRADTDGRISILESEVARLCSAVRILQRTSGALVAGGLYTIRPRHSKANRITLFTELHQISFHLQPADGTKASQRFKVALNSANGSWSFLPEAAPECALDELGIDDALCEAKPIDHSNKSTQQFIVENIDGGWCHIRSFRNPQLLLDVNNEEGVGGDIILWRYNGEMNQQFRFHRVFL